MAAKKTLNSDTVPSSLLSSSAVRVSYLHTGTYWSATLIAVQQCCERGFTPLPQKCHWFLYAVPVAKGIPYDCSAVDQGCCCTNAC